MVAQADHSGVDDGAKRWQSARRTRHHFETMQAMSDAKAGPPRGFTVSAPVLLDLVRQWQDERSSLTLLLGSDEAELQLIIREGALEHAVSGQLTGLDAIRGAGGAAAWEVAVEPVPDVAILTIDAPADAVILALQSGLLPPAEPGDPDNPRAVQDTVPRGYDTLPLEVLRRVRKISQDGTPSTTAGDGSPGQLAAIAAEDAPPEAPSREVTMTDIKQAQTLIDSLRDSMDGLLATDIWDQSTGMPIVGHNSKPRACALFNRLTDQMTETLTGAEDSFVSRIDRYLIEVENGMYIVIVQLTDRFRWGLLVDGSRCQLGLLWSVFLPDYTTRLRKALG